MSSESSLDGHLVPGGHPSTATSATCCWATARSSSRKGSDGQRRHRGQPCGRGRPREGDIITAVGGERIDATHILDELLTQYEPGDEATLSILRDGGTEMEVTLTLGSRPSDL